MTVTGRNDEREVAAADAVMASSRSESSSKPCQNCEEGQWVNQFMLAISAAAIICASQIRSLVALVGTQQ